MAQNTNWLTKEIISILSEYRHHDEWLAPLGIAMHIEAVVSEEVEKILKVLVKQGKVETQKGKIESKTLTFYRIVE